jgi:signal transduction histidine kinase
VVSVPGDGDEDRRDRPRTVPIDAVPDPVVGYRVRDGEPLVGATNDAFERVLGSVSTGTAVRRWLRSTTDADEPRIDEVCSALADGRDVDAEFDVPGDEAADARTFRLRTLDGAGDSRRDESAVDGYVVVSELRPSAAPVPDVDRIASVLSHDLRNPLDVANAHLRAARETGADEHFDEVRQAHDRMERIVRDVLTLARGERAPNVVAGVDPGAVATDAWGTVDTGSASLTVDDDLPAVDADPDRLQRLFENLFRNSLEHARPGPGATGPDRETAPDESLQVRVGHTEEGWFVADDGVGIPEDERERVFEPGYSTSEAGSGAGLGLPIVARIADAHDWNVSVATGPSGGARFDFRPTEADN